MIKDLIKKYRIDSVSILDLGVEAGIYVNPTSGEFYARVPETESGTRYASKSKPDLEAQVRAALRAHYVLLWEPMIVINYPGAMRYRSVGGAWSSGRGVAWDAADPRTASDCVGPLMVSRCEVAQRHDGRIMRAWPPQDGRSDHRRIQKVCASDNDRFLPYSEGAYYALLDFKDKIADLDHRIRLLLRADDLEARLLVMMDNGAPLGEPSHDGLPYMATEIDPDKLSTLALYGEAEEVEIASGDSWVVAVSTAAINGMWGVCTSGRDRDEREWDWYTSEEEAHREAQGIAVSLRRPETR